MRKLLSIAACGLLAAACSNTPSYHITGSAPEELNGQTLYLRTLDDDAQFQKTVDSTTVMNGKFEFKGVAEKPLLARIETNNRQQRPVSLILEKGDINVTLGEQVELGGTQSNDSLQVFYGFVARQQQKQADLVSRYRNAEADKTLTPEMAQEIMASYDSISWINRRFDSVFVANNTNNLAGLFILSNSLPEMSMEEVEGFLANATPEFKDSPLMQKVDNYIAAQRRSAIGAEYTNLTMQSLDGQTISLSDFVGKDKYVLVDFWASWCGPCRREMPNLVEAYKKYADKGFEIVGVSFDDNKEAWAKGVEELGITWPQMSDLKGWKCLAGEVYGIRSIPSTLLIDKEGKIVAKNLRGNELEETLAKYLD